MCYCGKKSKDKTEIIKCEAAHLNLAEEEYRKWEELKQNVRYASHIVTEKCMLRDLGQDENNWIIDKDIPIFKGEDRQYIEQLVNVGEE